MDDPTTNRTVDQLITDMLTYRGGSSSDMHQVEQNVALLRRQKTKFTNFCRYHLMRIRRPVIRSEGRGWQPFHVVEIAGGILSPVITDGHRLLNLIAGDNDRVSIKDGLCPDKFLIHAGDSEAGQFRRWGKCFSSGGWWRCSKRQAAAKAFKFNPDFVSIHFHQIVNR